MVAAAATATAPSAATEYEPSPPERSHAETSEQPRKLNRRRLNRRTRVSRITEALKATGQADVAAAATRERVGLSHLNFRSRDGPSERFVNFQRHREDVIPTLARSQEVTLERIVASYIQHQVNVAEAGQADWMSPYTIRPADGALLSARGYNMDDLRLWAGIISSPDSLEAAQALAKCIATRGLHSIPLFALLYLLRRPYISARALRIITEQSWRILGHHTSSDRTEHAPQDAIFMIFTRLLRHAREVWPMSLESLPEILLQYLPRARPNAQEPAVDQLQTLTYMLNKAMRLTMLPTAVEPFKNNRFQEAGIVRILRFMAEHDPPLQINREGYRAVTLLQLAQRKRPNEQQWAELKALSWPPWKEYRTAMDAAITLEEHGMSKAAETLKRMREAGYGHLAWEEVASIYTGWDTDRTPTIQTLALFGTGGDRFHSGTAKWVARITTTRTAQEAWACFLAYEDKKLPPNQAVYLAVFQKLHKEDQRLRELRTSKDRRFHDRRRRIFPGDTQEVEPLPPSIHLYTYTRTPPPAVDGFYRQLRQRGVVFHGRCLAFLVANAGSLKLGVEYLLSGTTRHPEIHKLLHPGESHDLTNLPMPIFAAFVELLSRFSNVPFPSAFHVSSEKPRFHPVIQQLLDKKKYQLNGNHCIVRAAELLAWRRPLFRPAWNSVLQSLGRETSFQNIRAVFREETDKQSKSLTVEQEKSHGAITAYRIMRRVLQMMRQIHLDLDAVGFQALCQGLENVAIACWKILKHDGQSLAHGTKPHMEPHVYRVSCMVSTRPERRLKEIFAILVGNDSTTQADLEKRTGTHHELHLPRLLEVPSPAILHSYVRALGWMADYEGLLGAVRWMVANQTELTLRLAGDRNGEVMMRRTLVALRVFLERSWLPMPEDPCQAEAEVDGWAGDLRRMLRQLEAPASEETIDEIQRLVESVDDWGGWPDDDEVEEYGRDSRFQQFQ